MLPRVIVAAAMIQQIQTAFCVSGSSGPFTEIIAVRARTIATNPTPLGTHESRAAITVGEPW